MRVLARIGRRSRSVRDGSAWTRKRNSMGIGILAVLTAFTLATAPVNAAPQQQTTVNICDRTPEVETWILGQLPNGTACNAVTNTQLAGITADIYIEDYSSPTLLNSNFAGLTGNITKFTITFSPRLTELPANAFSGLSSLTELLLIDNELKTVHKDAFDDLTSLERLFLNKNALTTLDADTFESLTGLTNLERIVNRITTLDEDIFDGRTKTSSTASLACNSCSRIATASRRSRPTCSSR